MRRAPHGQVWHGSPLAAAMLGVIALVAGCGSPVAPVPVAPVTTPVLTGQVVDVDTFAPIAGAVVTAAGRPGSIATTDGAGVYRLPITPGMVLGEVLIVTTAAGYEDDRRIHAGVPLKYGLRPLLRVNVGEPVELVIHPDDTQCVYAYDIPEFGPPSVRSGDVCRTVRVRTPGAGLVSIDARIPHELPVIAIRDVIQSNPVTLTVSGETELRLTVGMPKNRSPQPVLIATAFTPQ